MESACRQLFLSSHIVTEERIECGGVLISEKGVIESILTTENVAKFLAENHKNLKVVDGGDLALLPGVVDSHVHINEPGRTSWEGFRTATAAAAAGGITTIIDMPLNSIPPTTTIENLKVKASAAMDNIFVDIGFWGGVIPGNEDSLKDLIRAGVVGFKCFLCPSGVEEFPHVNSEDLEKAFEALQGTESVLAFHAELETENNNRECWVEPEGTLNFDYERDKTQKKDPQEYATYLESRPPCLEINAIRVIIDFIKRTSVRVHIVHVSSSEAVPLLIEARRWRLAANHPAWRGGISAETCHHYLTLSADQVPRGRSEYKCAPPVRDAINKEKLWGYLLNDNLDLVVSDHSPCDPELKKSNTLEAWGGISSVQFGLSLFWTEASARGLDLRAIAKYLCSAPAHLCHMEHRKGAIVPGLEADLVFFDPDGTFLITEDTIQHRHKVTPYMNKTLRGVVKQTYLRGQLIYDAGNITQPPKGRLILNETEF